MRVCVCVLGQVAWGQKGGGWWCGIRHEEVEQGVWGRMAAWMGSTP